MVSNPQKSHCWLTQFSNLYWQIFSVITHSFSDSVSYSIRNWATEERSMDKIKILIIFTFSFLAFCFGIAFANDDIEETDEDIKRVNDGMYM